MSVSAFLPIYSFQTFERFKYLEVCISVTILNTLFLRCFKLLNRYSGASAARVWGSIYWENLKGFQDSPCMEKRILFRLLSGLHSSIMTQIANDYRFDDGRWAPNTKMFVNAVGMHPDRLTNMYFAYVFVLRAIGKARPFLMVSSAVAAC